MAWDLITWLLVAGGIIFIFSIIGGLALFLVAYSRHDKKDND